MKVKMSYFMVFVFAQIFCAHSLIVPDELPTLLSVIYSNIPIIKKGTDSRIGWGFRLGNRADFQVITELGPQTYTQPLGNQEDRNTNKRNTVGSLSNALYAQRQKEKHIEKQKEKVSDTEAGTWLESWSKSVKERTPVSEQEVPPGAKPGLAVGEIDAKSVIPDDAILKLQEMYKQGVVGSKMNFSRVDQVENTDGSESVTAKKL